ncbi:GlxA family transcriptional regulator [Paraburkholderia megapolitana]|uniref:Transcriptional regulator, AraC family with amidase-like domain n=1 Tax=Paraburkholderia megapolitana TaxID=420953 RepID=A0A1I3FPH1_9BURK|nr:helix-turn-helix domain-containing protein [Paraburkholderia megapolitana]QDQ82482.1 helix-turn-helix domain-containing protein [Paraburkholderia megapolitana]SFI13178.1 transcriptional regulator, AraC family with amidase-like domain [Paraburkholderia megapolitana]
MFDFTVLVLEDAYPSSVTITLDVLSAATALAAQAGVVAPRWRLCSVDGGSVQLQTGLTVQTSRLPVRPREDRSIWVVPGLGVSPAASLTQRLEYDDAVRAIKALARHAKAGGHVAASCSAVFLLNAAGLLQGRRATTSWWLAPLLKRMGPDSTVDADRMVCADGPVVTAGAAFAQTDLMLHLIRERCGNALADIVSRMLLIDGRQAQAPFIVPEVMANGNDLVARLAARVECALPHPTAVTALAQEFCMSERTLSRHVRRATGKSTLALVQSVRMRRARVLLETSRMTVEQVAEAVGYRDSTALRRLMKRVSGANPGRYRPAVAAP